MIVYKYLHPDRTDVLEKCCIRFTQPAALNDPFETLPDFTAYRESLRESIASKRLPSHRKVLDAFGVTDAMIADGGLLNVGVLLSRHFGILSLSRCRDNILMWSHYADSHRGFVVGFDSEDQFFSPATGKAVDGLRDVEYSKTRAVLPPDGLRSVNANEMGDWNDNIFFTKSDDWTYEQEMRILAPPSAADHRIAVPNGWDICLFRFQPSTVREIIAGAQCSEVLLMSLLRTWVDRFPEAEMFNAEISTSAFKVDVKPIVRDKAMQVLALNPQ